MMARTPLSATASEDTFTKELTNVVFQRLATVLVKLAPVRTATAPQVIQVNLSGMLAVANGQTRAETLTSVKA